MPIVDKNVVRLEGRKEVLKRALEVRKMGTAGEVTVQNNMPGLAKKGESGPKSVRVGDIDVSLVVEKTSRKEPERGKEVICNKGVNGKVRVGHQPSIQKLVRKYRSSEEDLLWAS